MNTQQDTPFVDNRKKTTSQAELYLTYQSRAFIHAAPAHKTDCILTQIKDDGEYLIRIYVGGNDVCLHGRLRLQEQGKGLYNYYHKNDILYKELTGLRDHVLANALLARDNNFPVYQSRAFLNTLAAHTRACIITRIDSDGDYSITIKDCSDTINLNGNLFDHRFDDDGRRINRGTEELNYTIHVLLHELHALRHHVEKTLEPMLYDHLVREVTPNSPSWCMDFVKYYINKAATAAGYTKGRSPADAPQRTTVTWDTAKNIAENYKLARARQAEIIAARSPNAQNKTAATAAFTITTDAQTTGWMDSLGRLVTVNSGTGELRMVPKDKSQWMSIKEFLAQKPEDSLNAAVDANAQSRHDNGGVIAPVAEREETAANAKFAKSEEQLRADRIIEVVGYSNWLKNANDSMESVAELLANYKSADRRRSGDPRRRTTAATAATAAEAATLAEETTAINTTAINPDRNICSTMLEAALELTDCIYGVTNEKPIPTFAEAKTRITIILKRVAKKLGKQWQAHHPTSAQGAENFISVRDADNAVTQIPVSVFNDIYNDLLNPAPQNKAATADAPPLTDYNHLTHERKPNILDEALRELKIPVH